MSPTSPTRLADTPAAATAPVQAEGGKEAAAPGRAAASASPSPRRRALLTAAEKLVVLDWFHANGRNQKRTAAHFHAQPRLGKLNQGTISRWLLAEHKIRAAAAQRVDSRETRGRRAGGGTGGSPAREKSLRHPELERCLTLWLDRLDLARCARLSGREIKAAAVEIYDRLAVPTAQRLELSNGWLGRFQTRQGLKLSKPQSETLATPDAALDAERRRLAGVIAAFLAADSVARDGGSSTSAGASRSLHDVWNVDETAILSDYSPLTATRSTVAMQRRTAATTRFTVALATNATGTERLEPLVIGRESTPRCFRGQSAQELGFRQYASDRMAWMTSDVFGAWLRKWDQELVAAGRHVLLLVDAFRGHVTDLTGVTNIQLEFFPPLLTHRVQPCSLGLSAVFQALYRRSVVLLAAEKLCRSTAIDVVSEATLFTLNELEVLALVKAAWQAVKPELVASCWVQAGILPSPSPIPGPAPLIHEAIATAIAQETSRLHQALQVLQMEGKKRRLTLECVDADTFSRLGLADAACTDLSIEEAVQIATGSGEPRTERTEQRGATSKDHRGAGARASPDAVLEAQTRLERYWQLHGFELSAEVQRVLQESRRRLQQSCSGGR